MDFDLEAPGGDTTLRTTVNEIAAQVDTNDLLVDETNALSALNLAALVGDIQLEADGPVSDTDGDVDITANVGSVIIGGAGGDFGTAASAIDTSVNSLSVDTSTNQNDQFTDETDGLNDLDLNAGTGDVTLMTGGAVTDGLGDAEDVRATNANLDIDGGDLGTAANMIETAVTSLTVDTSTDQTNQFIDETDVLNDLDLNAGTGDVTLMTGGAVTDGLGDAEDVRATNANLDIDGGDLGTAANMIETAVTSLTVDTSTDQTNQFIDETDALNDLDLNAGTGDVTLMTGGAVTDGLGDAEDVRATNASLDIDGGDFGTAANMIETAVVSLSVDTSTNQNDQFTDETDGLSDLNLNAGMGNVTLMTGGAVTDDAADAEDVRGTNATLDIDGGNFGTAGNMIETAVVSLSVDTSTNQNDQFTDETDGLSDLNLNAGMGNVTLMTGGAVTDDAADAEDVRGTNATLDIDGGNFGTAGNMIETAVVSLSVDTSTNQNDQFTDETDGLSDLNLNAGMGNVTLMTGGAVTDDAADAEDVRGTNATLDIDDGNFGTAGNMIETAVVSLSVDTSTNQNDQFTDETDGLSDLNLNAGMGNVTLMTGGAVTDDAADAEDVRGTNATLDIDGGNFGTAGNMIETAVVSLSVDTSTNQNDQFTDETDGLSDLNLNAGMGNVTLMTGGAVTDDAADAEDIRGTNATLDIDGGNFGTAGNMIETAVVSLSVDTSTNQNDQFTDETDGLSDLNLNAGMGNVTLMTGGAVTDDAADAEDVRGTNATLDIDGGNFGTAGNNIETAVTSLSVDTATNQTDQFIQETDDLSNLDLNTNNVAMGGAGNVRLTAGGAVQDDDAGQDVAADDVVFVTGAGIGDSANAIGANVNNLEANSGGALFITNSTALTIGGVGPGLDNPGFEGLLAMNDINVATTNGDLTVGEAVQSLTQSVNLNAAEDLGVNAQVSAQQDVVATASQDLNVMQNVSSTTASVMLGAGNNLGIDGVVTADQDIQGMAGNDLGVMDPITSNNAAIMLDAGNDITIVADVLAESLISVNAGQLLDLATANTLTTDFGAISGSALQKNAANEFVALESSRNPQPQLAGGRVDAEIEVIVSDPLGLGFLLEIQWDQRRMDQQEIDIPPTTEADFDDTADVINLTLNGDNVITVPHTYTDNPSDDPEKIEVPVTITFFGFSNKSLAAMDTGSLQLTDGSGSLNGQITVTLDIDIRPGDFVIAQAVTAPEPLPTPFPTLPTIETGLALPTPEPQEATTQQINTSTGVTSQQDTRHYELRIVAFDEAGNLTELPDPIDLSDPEQAGDFARPPGFELSKLPDLFERLPDDRYRIYLVEEDGAQRLVLDFLIRNGRPVEAPESEQSEQEPEAAEGEQARQPADGAAVAPGQDAVEGDAVAPDDVELRLNAPIRDGARTTPPASTTPTFAERFGSLPLPQESAVLGATAISLATSAEWEQQMDRALARFGHQAMKTRSSPSRTRAQ